MNVCINCFSVEDREVEFCANCGQGEFGKINKKGYLVNIPAGSGMPCQGCLHDGHDLKFRYYRTNIALIVWAQIGSIAGYLCFSCRWKTFAKSMATCLVLGWWNFWFLFVRNPAAIVVNLWAMFASPLNAPTLGAIDIEDIRSAAEEEEKFSAMYAAMPSWLNQLEEHEVNLIIADVDYYEILGVSRDASLEVIKTAWRQTVKMHHPDSAGTSGRSEMMPLINDAHAVLCEERLRYAYDHRNELIAESDEAEDSVFVDDEQGDAVGYNYGCRVCYSAFLDAGDLAGHVLAEHPGVAYSDAHQPLKDGVPVETTHHGRQGWKCKHCDQHFDAYDDALSHANEAHPDHIAVDPRSAVEQVG